MPGTDALADSIAPPLLCLLRASGEAAVVAGLVWLAQLALGRWMTPAWRYRLWGLVVLRLLLPVLPASPASLWNLGPTESIARLFDAPTSAPTHRLSAAAVAAPVVQDLPTPPAPGPTVAIRYEPIGRPDGPVQRGSRVEHSAPAASPAPSPPQAAVRPQPEPAAPRSTFATLTYLAAAIWLAGVGVLLARLVASNLAFARRLRRAFPATNPAVLAQLADCCRSAGVARVPPVLVTDAVRAPAAAGVWLPRVLLPPGLLAELSADERRAVLLHELAHVRCRDVAGNWLLAVLAAVHWFNPAVWLAFARLRADREVARDAMVLAIVGRAGEAGGGPRALAAAADGYARTLLMLAERLSTAGRQGGGRTAGGRAAVPGMVGIIGDDGGLLAHAFPAPSGSPTTPGLLGRRAGLQRRLRMITGYPTTAARRLAPLGPVLLVAIGCGTLTGAQPAAKPSAAGPASRPATQPLAAAPTVDDLIDSTSRLITRGKYAEALGAVDQLLARDPKNDYGLSMRPLLAAKASQPAYEDVVGPGPDWPGTKGVKEIPDSKGSQRGTGFAWSDDSGTTPVGTQPGTASASRPVEQTVADMVVTARRLTSELKYRQAIGVVDQILARDPRNEYAVGVRPLLADRAASSDQRKYRERLDAGEKKIPYEDILGKPLGWPDISTLRDRTVAAERESSPEERAVRAQLERKLPEVRMENMGFADAIEFLRNVSGANIFVNWKALEAAGVERATAINLRLYNIKVSKALQIILDSASKPKRKLGYTIDEGVVSISTEDDLSKNVLTRVYDVRDLLVDVPDAIPPGEKGGQSTPGTRPATSPPPATRPAQATAPTSGEDARAKRVADIVRLIRETIAPDSWRETGGNIGAMKEMSGQLIVTQTPENHRALISLLEQLREQRGVQVLVEARFVSTGDAEVDDLVGRWRRDAKFAAKTRPATGPALTNLPADTIGAFLDDAQVAEFLWVSGAGPASTVLAAPRLMLFNGQRSFVLIGSSRAYVWDYATVTGAGGEVRYEPVVAVAESGLTLDVQATGSADRQYVTLELRPKVSALLGMAERPWANRPAGSTLTVQEPRMRASELQTTVSVPDGRTLLLGGMEDPGLAVAGAAGTTQPAGATTQPATRPAAPDTRPAGPPRRLYLLVTPKLVVRPAATQPAFPLLDTRP